jgi:hypothetical protein
VGSGFNEITVGTGVTDLISLAIPNNTLGVGNATDSRCMDMKFNVINNTGNRNVTYKIWYGTSSFDLFGPVGGTTRVYGHYVLCNDAGLTGNQTIIALSGVAGTSFAQLEPVQDSTTGNKVFKLTAQTDTSSDTLRVWAGSIR